MNSCQWYKLSIWITTKTLSVQNCTIIDSRRLECSKVVLSKWMEVPAELRESHVRMLISRPRARGPLVVKLVPLLVPLLEPKVVSLVLAGLQLGQAA